MIYRAAIGVPLTALAVLLQPLCPPAVAQAGGDSLARAVPAHVNLFVELRNGGDLLISLAKPEAWLTLAELTGPPADVEETGRWRQRIEQLLGMSPEQAILTMLSRRVGYVSESLRSGQDAVVFCEPLIAPRELARRWQARPLPTAGRTSLFRLPNNVGVGVSGELMILGDIAGNSAFTRVLEHLDAERSASLADDPVYARLLSRVPRDPTGVFFARIAGYVPPPVPVAQPATTQPGQQRPRPPEPRAFQKLPALLHGSSNVLLALHRQDSLLHFTAVGDAPQAAAARDGSLPDLVGRLPQRTLIAWAGPVDYAALSDYAERLPERHALRVAYMMQQRGGTIERITRALNPATCVALGVVTPERRTVPAPPIPAVALLISARDAAAAAVELDVLLESSVALYKLLSLRLGTAPLLAPACNIQYESCDVEQYDLSALLGPMPEKTPLAELHLSWTLDGDVLIIATHTDWIRQIVAARHDHAPRLEHVLKLTGQDPSDRHETVFVAQPGPIADLGQLWLRHFRRHSPEILNEDWWRGRQPTGTNLRLGIQVTQDAESQRLRVTSVTPGTPADGVLQRGDEILGCHPHRFRTDEPVSEIINSLANRPNARWLDLIVERDRIVRVRRIPLPFVDPIEVLRRVIAVGEIVQRVVYHDDVPDAEGPRGFLTLELRREQKPLFAFVNEPASRPTTHGSD